VSQPAGVAEEIERCAVRDDLGVDEVHAQQIPDERELAVGRRHRSGAWSGGHYHHQNTI
jgi:hypothetical protein